MSYGRVGTRWGTAHVNARTVGPTVGAGQDPADLRPGQIGSRSARWLLAAGVLLLLVISWYPFELELPATRIGGVETLADGSLRFVGDEFASTPRPPSWLPAAIGEESLAVSLRVRPDTADQDGPARILALSPSPIEGSEDLAAHDLVIGQSGPDLVVRVRRPGSDGQGRPAIVVPSVLTPSAWHEIDLELDDDLRLSVDGEPVVLEPGTAGWAAAWDPDHRLSLGNTLSGARPWAGTIARARVMAGGEQVDLLASDELDVPGVGRRLPPRLREAASRVGAGALMIGVLHTLLGVGLGAAAGLARPARPFASNLWVVPVLGALANLGKVVVATRHPSIATFLLQSGGGGLGALAAVTFLDHRRVGAGGP